MAKFELELSIRDKRTLMSILTCSKKEYEESLSAAKRSEVVFESEEQEKKLVRGTERAVEILDSIMSQLHNQDPR